MKNLVWLLVLSFVVVATGCGASQKNVGTGNSEVQDAVTLKVGLEDTYPPFEYRDEASNELVGFDIDFSKALAEEIGAKIEYVPTAWDGIFDGLGTGKYDMIVSSISITPDRKEQFAMTKPYLANGIIIISAAGGERAAFVNQLDGKRVGVQRETTADDAVKKFIADGRSIEVSRFSTIVETFAALKSGSVDFILTDSSVGSFHISQDSNSFDISSGMLSNEPIGVCIAKENKQLADKVNAAISKLQESGKMKELSMKWFAEDYVSHIDDEVKVIK